MTTCPLNTWFRTIISNEQAQCTTLLCHDKSFSQIYKDHSKSNTSSPTINPLDKNCSKLKVYVAQLSTHENGQYKPNIAIVQKQYCISYSCF